MNKKRTKSSEGRAARVESANGTYSIGPACKAEIRYLVGRHKTLAGIAAISGSEVIRDLVRRAYEATKKRGRA